MKKEKEFLIFGLVFLASLISLFYCMMEFRKDLITIIGVAVVVLITAYLWLDTIKSIICIQKQELQEKLDKLEKLEKAIYVITKNSKDMIEIDVQDTKKILKTLEHILHD